MTPFVLEPFAGRQPELAIGIENEELREQHGLVQSAVARDRQRNAESTTSPGRSSDDVRRRNQADVEPQPAGIEVRSLGAEDEDPAFDWG